MTTQSKHTSKLGNTFRKTGTDVLIAIQVRSTSKRLPAKSLELIDTKTMTDHILDAAFNTARYINRSSERHGIHCKVVLVVPKGDILEKQYYAVDVFTGPEEDVLTRYMIAFNVLKPHFVVRLTGDCPLMSPAIITKHIMCAVKDDLDYCSNVTNECRTFIDGWDVEVISNKFMKWLDENALLKKDREHVTTLAREVPPHWAKVGTVINSIDFSDIKLSVDTQEELERVRKNKNCVREKINRAREMGHNVYTY